MIILFTVVGIVLIASAICAGVEAALFSVPLIKARQLADAQVRGAKSLLKISEAMSRPIAMIVILTNISNIVGSMVIGVLAGKALDSQWIGVFSTVFTLVIIMFSEIIPKTLGERHNEKISLMVARPILLLTKLMLPVIWIIEKITNPFIRGDKTGPTTNESEIRYLAKVGEKEGEIEQDELEMIQGVFKLNDINAKDLMTPRVAMTCIDSGQKVMEVKQALLDSQHSRIVVTNESRDDVKGFVLRSELLACIVEGKGEQLVCDHIMKPLTVSETDKVDTILPKFQKSRKHLAIVEDEFRGVSGLITLEDIVEELTGEIVDETDEVEDMRQTRST